MSFITSPGVIVPPLTAGGVAYGTGSQAKVTSAGTPGQVLISAGAGVPTFQTLSQGNFGTDLSFVDHTLTVSSAITTTLASSLVRLQAVSLDGVSELLILQGSNSTHAVVYNTSTDIFGTPVLVRTANLNNVRDIGLAKISSTQVLVCSLDVGTTTLETVVLTISGSTIAVGTALATTLAANSSLVEANTRLVTVGSSYVLNYSTDSDQLPKFRAITVSGSTPSIGAELAYAGGTNSSQHHAYAHSASILLHFSVTGASTVYVLPITVSGTTLTAGTEATVTTTAFSIVTGVLSNSRYALFYSNVTGRGAVVSVTGTVASISTAATTVTAVDWNPTMQVFGNQAFVKTGTGNNENINVITDTAGVATLGTSIVSSSTVFAGFLSTGKVLVSSNNGTLSNYTVFGISAGSPVLEKTFGGLTSGASSVGGSPYGYPLSGLPQSGSGYLILCRTSTGKTTAYSGSTASFTTTIDGVSIAKLQERANPFNTFNDGISDSVAWGMPNAVAANTTTVQLRKVTLV